MNEPLQTDLEVGRKPGYSHLGRSEMGRNHTIYLSDSAWEYLNQLAKAHGYTSRSALLEAIGTGKLVLGDNEPTKPTPPPSTAPTNTENPL